MVKPIENLFTWIIYFFVYAFIGWVFESIYCSIKERKGKFVNRGFLIGPICPIYGFGGVLITFLTYNLSLPIYLDFLIIVFVCSLIEYLCSILLEKIFHARWWDYSSYSKFHLDGRVSLSTSLGFGIGGLIIKYFIHSRIISVTAFLSVETQMYLSILLLILVTIDYCLSSKAALNIRHILTGGNVDLTEEIKKFTINYYRKQTRRRRKIAKVALRNMKKMQKKSFRQFRKMQRGIKKAFQLEELAKITETAKNLQPWKLNLKHKKMDGKDRLKKKNK